MANRMSLPSTPLITNYIINNITGDKIVFKTLPEDISESYAASFDSTEVRGRSAPYFGYAGSEARSVTYSITLSEDILGDEYMNIIGKLKALVYPKYSGSLVIPPYCTIKLGDMIDYMYAVVNSVSVSWSGTILSDNTSLMYDVTNPKSFSKQHYSKAEVSLDITQIIRENLPTANNPMSF